MTPPRSPVACRSGWTWTAPSRLSRPKRVPSRARRPRPRPVRRRTPPGLDAARAGRVLHPSRCVWDRKLLGSAWVAQSRGVEVLFPRKAAKGIAGKWGPDKVSEECSCFGLRDVQSGRPNQQPNLNKPLRTGQTEITAILAFHKSPGPRDYVSASICSKRTEALQA